MEYLALIVILIIVAAVYAHATKKGEKLEDNPLGGDDNMMPPVLEAAVEKTVITDVHAEEKPAKKPAAKKRQFDKKPAAPKEKKPAAKKPRAKKSAE